MCSLNRFFTFWNWASCSSVHLKRTPFLVSFRSSAVSAAMLGINHGLLYTGRKTIWRSYIWYDATSNTKCMRYNILSFLEDGIFLYVGKLLLNFIERRSDAEIHGQSSWEYSSCLTTFCSTNKNNPDLIRQVKLIIENFRKYLTSDGQKW